MHGLLSNAYAAFCVSAVALGVGCTGLLLAFFARKSAVRALKSSTQALHEETQTALGRIDEEVLDARHAIEEFRQSLVDVRNDADSTARTVREVIKTIADRHAATVLKAETNGEGEKSALRQVYETAKAERSRFSPALASIAPLISGLCAYQHRGNSEMEGQLNGVINDFQQMMDIDTHLSSRLEELATERRGSALHCEELARSFESGAMPDAAYLAQVLSIHPVEHRMLADPVAEQSRLKDLQLRRADVFLAWLDRVNELRAFSMDRDSGEVAMLCTNIIRQSRGVLGQLDVEVDDVEVGRTMFDARLHDLVHTVSTAKARPETVIGVLQLGYRRNGRVMRKPQVLVAAAEG